MKRERRAPAGNRKHSNMEEKHEKSRATQVVLYLENFGGPRFELVLLPQRQSIWPRVVVPCSFFKKVLLLVDLDNYQGTTTRGFVVCRWRGSRHELRRARRVQCRREDGDAVKSRQNVVPSFVTGRLWGFSFKGRAGGGRADGGGRTGIFNGTGFLGSRSKIAL